MAILGDNKYRYIKEEPKGKKDDGTPLFYIEIAGDSSWEKPLVSSTNGAIADGSKCTETDTGKKFLFNEKTGKWASEASMNDIGTYLRILADDIAAKSWPAFRQLLNDGLASKSFPVGSQIADTWAKAAGTEYDFLWDIMHYDAAGDVFLKWHYAFPDGVPFDEPEAIYYAPDGGLAAGQYYISIGTAYGTGWSTSKHINFTLTAAMDAGDQLFIDFQKDNAKDPTDGKTWNVYAKGGTSSKQSGTTSDGTTGTELGTIGAVNAHRPNGNLNAISRAVYGYGRWSQSAIRQWLNSDKAANAWWTAQNPWDRPSSVHNLRGHLAGYSEEFINILEPIEVVTALNTQEGFAEASETTYDKIFLPSLEQMYINPEWTGEGEAWDYYKELAEQAGLTGKFQRSSTYPVLISYNVSNHSSAVHAWLRSANRGSANSAWVVYSSGYVSTYSASYALRGCPACKIKKSV